MPLSIPRGPVRITATLPRHLYEALFTRADVEGRSLSNLVAFLLEKGMAQTDLAKPDQT